MDEESSALLALEMAQELSARVDAFFNRKEERQRRKEAKKAAKRARRDGEDPLSSPTTREYEAPPDLQRRLSP